MIAGLVARRGADGGWCRRRSSKPFRGAHGVPGGFDSHTLPYFYVHRRRSRSRSRFALCVAVAFVALAGPGSLLAPSVLRAQEDAPPPEPAEADTGAADSLVSPVIRPAEPAPEEQPRSGPAPMSAFFRSVLIPGWGQLAADKPVRGAFYFAMQTATVYMVIRTQNRIDEAEGEALKESRREQREDWLVLAGFWALASGVDAWVSAQMWGFEGEVVPPPDGSPGLAVRMSLPAPRF